MNIALAWYEAGCSVVPIAKGGKKNPTREWTTLQKMRLTRAEVDNYWRGDEPYGVALICGAVSGNLEMLELEAAATTREAMSKIHNACVERGIDWLWDELNLKGYVEWTPSGGLHYLYRMPGEIPGNTKIAVDTQDKTLSETRGEGGYVIVAPTAGYCHPSGETWEALNGRGPGDMLNVLREHRDVLHAAIAEALDERPAPAPRPERRQELVQRDPNALRPGDDFNLRADWADILEPEGWTVGEYRGKETLWVRPGKDRRDGHSASTGYAGDADRLYVWSTSAGLPHETPLTKFYVYTHYVHGGDFRSATRELSRMGYGARVTPALSPFQSSATAVAVIDGAEEQQAVRSMGRGDVPQRCTPEVRKMLDKTDPGNARYLDSRLGDRYRFVAHRNKWFRYDGGVWSHDPQGTRLIREATDLFDDRVIDTAEHVDKATLDSYLKATSVRGRNAAIDVLRGFTVASVDDFDADRNLLNVANGILDLTTMQLAPHSPDALMTKKFGAGFDPTATAPRWEQYLKEVLPDAADREFVQRMAGYTLLGKPVERAMMVLHGPGGTGKSRFIETISSVFGTYAETASEGTFRAKKDYQSGPSNDLMNLRGARLASMSELDYGVKMDEALIKRMTGQDKITSRHLYEENQTWMPQCVIWMATNHLFRVSSDDGAIWERIRVVTFDQKIEGAARDPLLADKLEAEADGIFNWMLQGLAMYREDGLPVPPRVEAAVAAYKDEQDTVGQFIGDMLADETLIATPNAEVECNTLFQLYETWCKGEHERAIYSRTRFNRRMESLNYVRFKKGRMYWKGLAHPPRIGSWIGSGAGLHG